MKASLKELHVEMDERRHERSDSAVEACCALSGLHWDGKILLSTGLCTLLARAGRCAHYYPCWDYINDTARSAAIHQGQKLRTSGRSPSKQNQRTA